MDLVQDFYFSKLGVVGHSGKFYTINVGQDAQGVEDFFAHNKFIYLKDGHCVASINGTEYEGGPGRLFLIPAGNPFFFRCRKDKPFSFYEISFDMYPNNKGLFELLDLPLFVDAKDDYRMLFFFSDYISRYNEDSVADMLHIKSCLMEMLIQYMFLAECDDRLVEYSKNNAFNRMMDFIDQNIDKNVNIAMLAEEFHFHPNHLIRVFKKKTGMAAAKYIKTRKMEMVKRLIEDTDLSMGEIMHRMGERDMAHFSKMFKSVYGLSPRAYRQKVRANISKLNDGDMRQI